MQWRGRDIWRERVPRGGISYSPILDWIFAAVWANYTPTAFFELDGDEQALIVAAYRSKHQIDAVLAQDQIKRRNRRQ